MSSYFSPKGQFSSILTYEFTSSGSTFIGWNNFKEITTKLLRSYFSSKFPTKKVTSSKAIHSKKTPSCLIGKFSFQVTSKSVVISFTYYMSFPTSKGRKNQFSLAPYLLDLQRDLAHISVVLTKLLKKEVHIKATQIHYPYLESTILAQYLAHNAPSNTFIHFQEAILSYPSLHVSTLPSFITGLKVQLSGRITTEPLIPRLSVKSTMVGTFSSSQTGNQEILGVTQKNQSFLSLRPSQNIDYSAFTTKNEIGAFTIKVWIASTYLSK